MNGNFHFFLLGIFWKTYKIFLKKFEGIFEVRDIPQFTRPANNFHNELWSMVVWRKKTFLKFQVNVDIFDLSQQC